MDNLSASLRQVESDPAILAFVKCHLTSFLRWELLRLFAGLGERWTDAIEVARLLHKPLSAVEQALLELQSEGLLAARPTALGTVSYRLTPGEPSSLVVERLVRAATRSQELRQIIIARVVGGDRLAS